MMRSLSAPSQLSPRRVQQTVNQKDATFQTPRTHTQHTQIIDIKGHFSVLLSHVVDF